MTGVGEVHRTFLMYIESLHLEEKLHQFNASNKSDPMFQWARMYMRQVMTLLQLQRAIREGNWHLYLASLEHRCKYFFAYASLDYAQNIPEFIARMDAINTSDPELRQSFNNGEFAVNTSNRITFTRIGVDQAMDHLNKPTKGQEGSLEKSYPATLLKFCLIASELARLAKESEQLVSTTTTTAPAQHHQLS